MKKKLYSASLRVFPRTNKYDTVFSEALSIVIFYSPHSARCHFPSLLLLSFYRPVQHPPLAILHSSRPFPEAPECPSYTTTTTTTGPASPCLTSIKVNAGGSSTNARPNIKKSVLSDFNAPSNGALSRFIEIG
ncbi:hypothetical protein E2C01_078137 [Portunus trituberculatus]|uniref:Uncharacterized protein n=1 Tax=Portunus trituberculatus TaxID=210409 RepID=A0A5B7IRX1_PORTR|nr:hypothetical protein [Portunus trituberculatus]